MVNYKLCAFADEADKALSGQIRAMQENGIEYLEMRGVNGINVAKLTAAEAKDAAAQLKAGGIKVWSLGSPAGKTPITDPFDFEKEQFKRLLETADIVGAHAIRLFSFYGTDGKAEYRDEVMERLSRFVEMAKGSGVVLCHVDAVHAPHFQIFDAVFLHGADLTRKGLIRLISKGTKLIIDHIFLLLSQKTRHVYEFYTPE